MARGETIAPATPPQAPPGETIPPSGDTIPLFGGGHDHRRRDRAHRDLGGGRTARRRAPRDVRAARRDRRAARGRVRHGGCRVARTLDQVVRLRLLPPGGWGGSAARRGRAAPTRVGALWPHTRSVRQYRSMFGWPACPGPGFARLDRMERRYAWLRRACGSHSRIWHPGASGGGAGPCAHPPRAPSGSCASSGRIGKDLALWEEGQEALMSQGGPSVRQVGVSGSSSSVRARSPTHDAYVSMDPGGTVVFRAWLVPGVRRHG